MSMSDWDEFKSRLAKGDKVEEIVNLSPEKLSENATKQKDASYYEEILIGDTEFKLQPMVPSLEEIKVSKRKFSPMNDLVVPKPIIPIGDILPLQPVLERSCGKQQ